MKRTTKSRITMLVMVASAFGVSCTKANKNETTQDQVKNEHMTQDADATPQTAADASAQNTTTATNDTGTQNDTTTGNPSAGSVDGKLLAANSLPAGLSVGELLSRIHHTNQMEIKMGQLAVQNASAKSVKSFGETLVKDHKEADEKVMALAKKENVNLTEPKAMNETEKEKMSDHDQLMTNLKSLKGKEFDKAFILGMKNGHDDAIASLEASNSSDEETKKLVSDLLPTLRIHQREAQAITQQLNFK